MNEIAKQNADMFHQPLAMPEPSLLGVISRAASDPNCDVGKMRELLDMYQRLETLSARKAYMAALSKVQTELPVITERGGIKNKSGDVQSTYALWEDINDAIKPVLQRNGFALSFRTGFEADKIVVTGVLSHRDGHSEQTAIHLPSDTSGSKNAVQAVGSSTSYGKRYTAAALLNITSRGADDDGKAGGGDVAIDEGQLEHVRTGIERSKSDVEKFCSHFKIAALPDLRAKDFQRAMEMLNTKAKAKS